MRHGFSLFNYYNSLLHKEIEGEKSKKIQTLKTIKLWQDARMIDTPLHPDALLQFNELKQFIYEKEVSVVFISPLTR